MRKNLEFWEEQMDLLAQQNYVIIEQFFPPKELNTIHRFFNQKQNAGVFKKAAIGTGDKEKIIKEIRGDYTYWLNPNKDQELGLIFEVLEELKSIFNRLLFLSLSDYEFHLAHYPKGSFYKKHLDQFDGRKNRMISVIIYLNENWQNGDGGELKIYPKNEDELLIAPLENRCVMFRSDTLFHEVLTSNVSRKSITGWMLYRPTEIPHLIV